MLENLEDITHGIIDLISNEESILGYENIFRRQITAI